MTRWAPAILFLPFLAACEPSWRRAGTSVEQADRDFGLCLRQARAEIPPRTERRQSSPERVVTRRVCQTQAGREVCRDEFVRREPARFDDVDLNREARRQRADACMRAQGYQLDGVELRMLPPSYVAEQ